MQLTQSNQEHIERVGSLRRHYQHEQKKAVVISLRFNNLVCLLFISKHIGLAAGKQRVDYTAEVNIRARGTFRRIS